MDCRPSWLAIHFFTTKPEDGFGVQLYALPSVKLAGHQIAIKQTSLIFCKENKKLL